ncbi:MAG TPA: DNA polymerase III subunit gamma/tau [Prosthecobacter sp.]
MSYQVFARKYRPKTFADVLGQEHVVRTLRNAIAQNRLAHAYLFVGPRGTGKTSTARIFAKALNCPDGPSVDFDPEDELCREIAEGRSLDVLEIDGASNNGVDQVRDLRESVKYAPSRSRFKIYYIDEVHMLSTAAFNALLKTLEEPPPHVKFIFATTEANKILPTIISRCQRFDLRRIPNTIIAKHLLHIAQQENVDLDEKASFAIAKGADGGMRDAQSMLDQLVAFCGNTIRENDVLEIFGFTAVQAVCQLAQNILDSDTVAALRLVHDTSEAGKDLGRMLGDLIQHFRTLLVSQADADAAAEDLEPEIADQVSHQSQLASTEQLLRIVDGLAEVDARMRWATNKRLHFELGVIQAVQNYNEVSISDVIEALDGDGTLPRPAPRPQAPVVARRAAAPAPAAVELAAAIPAPTPAPVLETAPAAPRFVEPEVAPAPPPAALAPAEDDDFPAQEEPLLQEEEFEPEPPPPAPAPEPAPEPAPAPVPAPKPAPAPAPAQAAAAQAPSLTNEEFRLELLQVVQKKRPLIASWLEATTVMSMARGIIKLGFPSSEAHAKESLARDNQRTFLEGLAEEILGTAMKFEMVVDPSLKPPPAVELFAGFDMPAAPPPAATPAPRPATAPVPVRAPAEAAPAAAAPAPRSAAAAQATEAAPERTPEEITADFINDPLIKSAIEKFKLKLAAGNPPQA